MLKKLVKGDPNLDFVLTHFKHFGRSGATASLQFNETPEADVMCMGNWGHSVFHKSYHTMFPLRAIRTHGAHGSGLYSYFLERDTVLPTKELEEVLYPIDALEQRAREATNNFDGKPTARAFFEWARMQRTVVFSPFLFIPRYIQSPLTKPSTSPPPRSFFRTEHGSISMGVLTTLSSWTRHSAVFGAIKTGQRCSKIWRRYPHVRIA